MAKAKKGKLTIEDALVPVEEQPYEIPENWCWTFLSSVADWGSGGTPSRKNPDYYKGNIPWIKTGELEDGYIFDSKEKITEDAIAHSSAKLFPIDSVLIAMYGATIGKTAILGIPATTNQACACARCKDALSNKYLFYYLRSQKDSFIAKGKGGAQPNISQDIIKGHSIPLPPLAEQKRIVEQIENLFSKLDEAKEKAQCGVESYESRKKAILYNAFEGLYSDGWRKKHNCSIDEWKDTRINEVCIPRAGYAFNSKKFTDAGFQIIRMGNLYAGKLDLSRSPVFYDCSDVDDSILKRSLVHEGDILLTLTGTKYKRDYGYAVCIEGNPELLVNQRILCLTPTEKIDKDYLLYYLRSEIFRDVFFSNETGGVNQGNVSSKFVENIEIKLPSMEEQKEISRILRTVLDNEEQAKDTAEFVIEQIDTIKKSILAKAFRGELGTNIANENSSMELLKEILHQG